MQDRFKFKVWDKNSKCFVGLIEINYMGCYVYVYNNNNESYQLRFDDAELLYPTGLKDINGKLIYEGDIMSFDDTYIGGIKGIGVVTWETDCTLVNAPGFYIWCVGGGFYPHLPLSSILLGNKYENPELLETKE